MEHPHDRFLPQAFSNPEHARGELMHLVGPELRKRIEWSTLELVDARFVDKQLSELRSDALFRVKLRDGRERFEDELRWPHWNGPSALRPLHDRPVPLYSLAWEPRATSRARR